MKRLLLNVLPLLFLSIGFSQNRVNVNNLAKYGDKYFKENDDRPFKKFSGNVEHIANFENLVNKNEKNQKLIIKNPNASKYIS